MSVVQGRCCVLCCHIFFFKGFFCLDQRCKMIPVCQTCWCKKNPISGKIFTKFYSVLFRKRVTSWFCAFWWHIFHILEHYVTFWHFTILVFWACYAVLSQIRFIVIYALFGYIFFGSNHVGLFTHLVLIYMYLFAIQLVWEFFFGNRYLKFKKIQNFLAEKNTSGQTILVKEYILNQIFFSILF